MSAQAWCWEAKYKSNWTSPDGNSIPQDVTELLIATPNALLHYKIITYRSGRKRIFTDVQAQGQGWWADAHAKTRRSKFYVQMDKAARRNGGGEVRNMPYHTLPEIMNAYDLNEQLKGDEKAINAWKTAMGAGVVVDWDATSSIEEAEQRIAKAVADKKTERERHYANDPMFGIF